MAMKKPFEQLVTKLKSLSVFNRIFFIVFPMTVGGICLLEVIIRWMDITTTQYNGVWLVLIPITFSVVLSFITAKLAADEITVPIKKLIESAKEIARGNFDHKIQIQSSEEIVQLSRIFNYMTVELKRILQMNVNQIIREKIKTEAILRNIADGVIVVGPQDEILLINDVVEEWFALKEAVVRNFSVSFFFPDLKFLIAKTKEKLTPEIHRDEVEILPAGSNSKIVLAAHASKVMDEKEIIAIVIVLRNITKEKEIDKMKTELVNVVAHELRSPLTSISGFSEILKDPALPNATRKEYTDIIHYESGRLAEMINRFLDISRIESGQTVMNKFAIEIPALITGILSVNAPMAHKKNIGIKTSWPPAVPPVLADADLIGQVVLNLFSNAVKYSPEGSEISIMVKVLNDEVQVQFKDMGCGISKENLKNLFQKFFRAKDDKYVKEVEGTGLGLAFVKEIIQQHGGRITVESELGKGSTFSFVLPAYKEETKIPAITENDGIMVP
jgi:PAS domain S-box-containing protein